MHAADVGTRSTGGRRCQPQLIETGWGSLPFAECNVRTWQSLLRRQGALDLYLRHALAAHEPVYGNGAAQGYTYSTQGDLLTLSSTLTGTSNTTTNTFTAAHHLASEAASNAAWAYVPAAFQTTNYSAANTLNQYVNITVGANPTQTMAYDANGNLTGHGVWTFAYDAQNMLRSAASAGGTSTYQYDRSAGGRC